MRQFGIKAFSIRTPIISEGDDLAGIVADSLFSALGDEIKSLRSTDVLGVTEAVVAKARGNYAAIDHIAKDVSAKFPSGSIGVVFPGLSRNRYLSILKGIARGASKVYILLSYPFDEVGNPLMPLEAAHSLQDGPGLITAKEFVKIYGRYTHPFTEIDYIDLYENIADNVEVYLSKNPEDILSLTKNCIAANIHEREYTKKRLLDAGAERVLTLCEILDKPVEGSGFNGDYGVLGSNVSTEETIKLFPTKKDCEVLISKVRELIHEKTGVTVEMLIYGDGAFKDPFLGIWELMDPVVSPAFTSGLSGSPTEVKLKYLADNLQGGLTGYEKSKAVKNFIKTGESYMSQGTTPRKYADLLGSLCDLLSGSGDKGTPLVLIQGYFDNYADE